MSFLSDISKSSIGKKQLMAVTGLLWTLFLLIHLGENALLIINVEKFNLWAHFLISLGPLLWIMEAGLLGTLLLHIGLAFKITLENKKARPVAYAVKSKKGPSNFAAETMIVTGVFMAAFLIWHIKGFKFGTEYEIQYGQLVVRDMARTVFEAFAKPWLSISYIIVMAMVGLHLSHGVQSSFQSLGWNHPKYTPLIKKLSLFIGILLGVGFSLIAVFSYLKGGSL